MFKRRTSRVRRRRQVKVLRANVMTPRIFWFDVLRMAGGLARMALVLALTGLAAWGVWRGIETGLIENEEFRLRELVLNENPALDEIRLLNVTGIDPSGSLFDCDPSGIESLLGGLPEIESARVTRRFPGTLAVEVTARQPRFWLACSEQGVVARDPEAGLLVDAEARVFRCPPAMFEEARGLPVIELRGREPVLVPGGRVEHPDFLRGRRLFDAALAATPSAASWVDRIRQHKAWGSKLLTRDGTEALFEHGNLERQMANLLVSIEHAAREHDKNIETIAVVGKRRIPVTYRKQAPPRAIIVKPAVEAAAEPAPAVPQETIAEPGHAPQDRGADPDLLEILQH